jgi:hypothetical protein
MTTRDDNKEAFLERWSRMKQEAKEAPPPQKPPEKAAVDPKAPPPELPPVDKLTIDSDFRAFFHPKVGEDVRRAALKKLFSDPRFNVMDGLDVYIDDYSKTEPIPPAMMAGLRQAQNILQWAKEDAEERKRKEMEQAEQRKLESSAESASQPPPETAAAMPEAAPAVPGEPAGKAKS